MPNPNSKKSLTDVLCNWFTNFSESFNCLKIGRIVAVNTSNQTVDVQILHKRAHYPNVAKKELRDYPLLKAVPFVVLGGGNSYLSFPISAGDNCLLLFNDYEIDRWWETGENLPSVIERKHDISDAFALVGVHSIADLIQGYSSYVHLKYSDNSSITVGETIDITNAQTNVSGNMTVAGDITGESNETIIGDITGNSTLTIVGDITGNSDLTISGDMTGEGNLTISKDIVGAGTATAELHSTHGASGVFVGFGGQTMTVQDGIVISMT